MFLSQYGPPRSSGVRGHSGNTTVSKMQAAVQQAQEMFDELDADHNGQLDIKELATLREQQIGGSGGSLEPPGPLS